MTVVSRTAADLDTPNPGMAAYAASKAALDQFARRLLLEVRQRGIKVMDTGFSGASGTTGSSWMLSAEDIAQTVLDLLRMRDGAHASRVELRPTRPQQR